MKTVILDDWEQAFSRLALIDELKRFSDVFIYHDTPAKEELIRRIKDAEVIIPIRERTKFTREILENLERIRLIAQTGTGVAHIDMEAATRLNIPVATTPGGSAAAVAELTFAFILGLSRQLLTHTLNLREGKWISAAGWNIGGKRLGIIGLGQIGAEVARLGKAFGMEVVAWGPRLTKERAEAQDVRYLPLEELLGSSHFVTLHVRLVPETTDLLTYPHFEMMRRDAFLINTSRGKVVHEEALIWALQNKKIAGAGLDVFAEEPLPADHPLRKMDNVLLTPHIGYVTDRSLENFLAESIRNIKSFILDGRPRNIVNQEVLARLRQQD